jgi:hypothetical protein
LAWLVPLCACGTSQAPDLASYQELTQQLTVAVESHRVVGSAIVTLETCATEHGSYDGAARALVNRMASMSGDLDHCMMDLGDTAGAEFHTRCASMVSELDRHAAMACQSAKLSQDWAETERHCAAMEALLQQDVSGEHTLSGMMSSAMMSGGMMTDAICGH